MRMLTAGRFMVLSVVVGYFRKSTGCLNRRSGKFSRNSFGSNVGGWDSALHLLTLAARVGRMRLQRRTHESVV